MFSNRKTINIGIFNLKIAAGISEIEIYENQPAVFITRTESPAINDVIEIEGQEGNYVIYDKTQTGLKHGLPIYQDYSSKDRIVVINKKHKDSDANLKDIATALIGMQYSL